MPAFFNAEKLAPAATGAAQQAFMSATPYTYVHLAGLLDDARLRAVREELSQLHRTFKETDLFKVFQTGDLGNLDPTDPTHVAALPQTLSLRDALYSPAFRAFVRRVTGCPPHSTHAYGSLLPPQHGSRHLSPVPSATRRLVAARLVILTTGQSSCRSCARGAAKCE